MLVSFIVWQTEIKKKESLNDSWTIYTSTMEQHLRSSLIISTFLSRIHCSRCSEWIFRWTAFVGAWFQKNLWEQLSFSILESIVIFEVRKKQCSELQSLSEIKCYDCSCCIKNHIFVILKGYICNVFDRQFHIIKSKPMAFHSALKLHEQKFFISNEILPWNQHRWASALSCLLQIFIVNL